MRGTSRASLDAVQDRFEPVLLAAGEQAATLGQELFALVDALDASGPLRRTLADPSLEGPGKAALVARLLAQADPRTVAVAQDLVQLRWSADSDLAEAAEHLAFHAVLASAQAVGGLELVEQELFRLAQALTGQREVRRGLYNALVDPAKRVALVDGILQGQGSPVTQIIARRAAAAPRGRRYLVTLGHIGDLVAERRSRQVATVTSASELTDAQSARLQEILALAYGRPIQLNVIVDENVLGGLRIQVGPDVVDSTVMARLADARRRLAS